MKEIVKKQNLLAVLEKHLLNIVKEAGEEVGKEAHDSPYIYENKLGKACFNNDAVYANSKDLARRNCFIEVLKERAYEIALNPKYDGYQRRLTSTV